MCQIYNRRPQQHRYLYSIFAQQLIPVRSMTSSCKSLSNSKIIVRVVELHERQLILNFIRLHYYPEEPLTAGSEPKQQDKEDEDWNMSHISQGMCFIALQNDDTNSQKNIVGALISGPKGPNEAKYLFEEAARFGPTKMGHILQFSACVERDANVCERFNVKKVLHIHVIVVNAEMRGQNIGHRLVEQVLKQAKSKTYEMVTVDCSSFYSARLFERMGFQCINIKYYKDYVNETGEQVFKPHAPHESVKTFALQLN